SFTLAAPLMATEGLGAGKRPAAAVAHVLRWRVLSVQATQLVPYIRQKAEHRLTEAMLGLYRRPALWVSHHSTRCQENRRCPAEPSTPRRTGRSRATCGCRCRSRSSA